MTWDEAVTLALAQPGAGAGTRYGQPAVRVNGHTVLNTGRESATSFCLHLDLALKAMLLECHPETVFETPHYAGWPAVLVRFDGADDALVREMVVRACDDARVKKPARRR